jgi:diguanylate cyclase (GGDEF)-like protein/PAS domain S-box-containing protein
VSRLRALIFDTGWLDCSQLRCYLAPRFGTVDLTIAQTEAELDEVLIASNDAGFDAVFIGVLPDATNILDVQSRLSANLPSAQIIVVTGEHSDTAVLARMDRNRVSFVANHQLPRIPYVIDRWSLQHRLTIRAVEDLPESLQPSDDLYQMIANLASDYVYITDIGPGQESIPRYRGERLSRMTGYSQEELDELGAMGLIHPDDRPLFQSRRESLLRGEARIDELRLRTKTGRVIWIRDYAYPMFEDGASRPYRVVGAAQDITNEKLLQNRLMLQATLLEMIARGEPITKVLQVLNDVVEEQIPDTICSIQLVDPEHNVLRPEVASRLPQRYVDAIWGLPISPNHGACGSAAFTKTLTISSDIYQDPRFDLYRDITRQFNFGAVWSTPVFDSAGDVVGTFALYFHGPREPYDYEIELMESAAQIAGLALETARRETERRLAQTRYQTLVEQTPAITLIANADDPQHITYLSPQFEEFSERPVAEILRNPEKVREVVHPGDLEHFDDTIRHARVTGEPVNIEFRIQRVSGDVAWVQVRMSLVRDQSGFPLHWLGVMLDVTERNEAIRQMIDSERRYRSLFDDNLNAIVTYDYEGRVVDFNPASERISGYSADEVRGKELLWLIAPEHRDRAERYFLQARAGISSQFAITIINRDGERIELSASQSPIVVDDEIVGVSSISEDVTDRRRLESQLLHQAYHDALTGLPNRIYFDQMLAAAISSLGRKTELAVLFMDLNDFKIINDSLGHEVGDKYLQVIGRRLQSIVPNDATVARFGGDEFTVLLPSVGDAMSHATKLAERIISELATPVGIDGYELGTSVSIGIAGMTYATTCDTGELIRRADIALYDAKRGSRESNYRIFNEGMDEWVFERLWIEGDLRQALANGEFEIHYQPLIDAQTREVFVVEALLRWNHPTRGLLVPDQFLRIAEESGHILEIDQWVLRTASQKVAEWNAEHPDRRQLFLGVNVSTRQFWNVEFGDLVLEVLEETGLDPNLLCIEITESTMMRDTYQASSSVRDLRKHGVLIAIDDFGTGYSSLSYLRQFPIDVLKIDRSFVMRLHDDEQQLQLVQAIVAMARALNLIVVAEGIETEMHIAQTAHLDCDLLQGFFISPPRPFNELLPMIEQQQVSVSRRQGVP